MLRDTPTPRVLLLESSAFSGAGGIEAYGRLMHLALSELIVDGGGELRTFVLNDASKDVDSRYVIRRDLVPRCFERQRVRFAVAVLLEVWRLRPHLIVFGHVHFAPIALVLRVVCPNIKQVALTYGVEVWQRQSAMRRRFLSRASRVLTISEFSKEALRTAQGVEASNVEILPCAIDPHWTNIVPEASPNASSRTILTVGRLSSAEAYKGVDQIICSLSQVRRQIPDVRFDIVGEGGDRPRLEAIAKAEGVADIVQFLGRVSELALAHAYAAAHPSAGGDPNAAGAAFADLPPPFPPRRRNCTHRSSSPEWRAATRTPAPRRAPAPCGCRRSDA